MASILPEALGFQNAIYHAARNFKSLFEKNKDSEDIAKADLTEDDLRYVDAIIIGIREKVSSTARNNVEKRYVKWKSDSTEVDNLESNRLLYDSPSFKSLPVSFYYRFV